MASLILAVRFLTIVPAPGREAEGPGALGRAAWWFPVVGLALGGVLLGLDRVLTRVFPPLLTAALVLAVWKILTGGIHLDGLADCLDGLAGRDREHRRAIMKDSQVGVFGLTGLALLFLLAFAALAEIPPAARPGVLLLAPAIGRLMPLVVGACVRGERPREGLGATFVQGLSGWAPLVHVSLLGGLLGWLWMPWGFLLAIAPLGAVLLWSRFLCRRLGRVTGDVLGSGVEVGELSVLLTCAWLVHGRLI